MKEKLEYTQIEIYITVLAAIIALASCVLFTVMDQHIIEYNNILSITCAIVCILSVSEIIFIKLFKEDANGCLADHKPINNNIIVIGIFKLFSIVISCFASAVLFASSIGFYQLMIVLKPIWILLILLLTIFAAFVAANKNIVSSVYK